MKLVLALAVLLVAAPVFAVSYPPDLSKEHEEAAFIDGAKAKDSYGQVVSPPIPKSWRLVSVTNGAEPNSQNLWFQDSDGAVYLMHGVMTTNRLTFLHENVYKIPAQ